jgi:hypothetical protein
VRVGTVSAVLWTLVVGLLGLYLLAFVLSAGGRLARPLDEITYGESWLLDDARRVARGEGLYTSPDQLPITHTAYMPLYAVMVGMLQRIVGDAGYAPGRAVSFLAAMVAAGALAWSGRCTTGRLRYGLLAAGLLLTQNLTTLLWAPLHRVDVLALGFTAIGLALARAGRVRLSMLPFLLAFLTKQTFLMAPLAVCLALWPCRRQMAGCAALFGGGVAVVVVVGQWLTGGWFLWHTALANSNRADFQTFAILMGSFFQFNGLAVLGAAALLFLPERPGERVWRLYFLLTLATLPTIAKLGASSNYWLESSLATAALVGMVAHRLNGSSLLAGGSRDGGQASGMRLVMPLAVAGGLLFAVPAYQATVQEATEALGDGHTAGVPSYVTLVGDTDARVIRVEGSLVSRVAQETGEVLTDNSGLAVAAGKRIAYEFQIFQLLQAEGRWTEAPILEAVLARRFSLVALMHPLDGPTDGPRWTPALRNALRETYTLVGEHSGFWLYRPT